MLIVWYRDQVVYRDCGLSNRSILQ